MSHRFSRVWPAASIAVLVLVLSCVVRPSRLCAQEPTSQPAPAASSSAAGEAKPPAQVKEEKEADPTEAFKHAAPVRWIARVTGLSLDQAYWLCMFLNFAIVFGSLWMVMRKRLPAAFRSRTELIQKRIEEARKTSEEARRRLSEVEGRLSRLDLEITEMRREAEENAREEEKRVRTAADEERQRIVAAAEQEIAMAANAARRDLKSYAAELAVDLAAKKIRVGKDMDHSLVSEFTAHLGKDGN